MGKDTLKRTFDFGKIAYNNPKFKRNRATVEMELRTDKDGKIELSICGNIWNGTNTDILSGGQNLDEMAKYIRFNPLFKKLKKWWELYHLNGMHPECEHQRELGWREIAGEKVTMFEYTTNRETDSKREKIEKLVMDGAKSGKPYETTADEQAILNAPTFFKTHLKFAELNEKQKEFYKEQPYKMEEKGLGWLRQKEHPNGILCKPCPTCGYEYGSAWLHSPIPENVLDEMKKLIGGKE